jgi:hypothetical protein
MDANQPTPKPEIQTTKQLAAARQIAAAIEHLRKQEFECAITLAAAAENILPPTDKPHIFSLLKKSLSPEEFKELNLAVNWLKHYKPEDLDPVIIPEAVAVWVILREITKFIAVYHHSAEWMEAFLEWSSTHHGYPVPRP